MHFLIKLRNLSLKKDTSPSVSLEKKIAGAWYGRICGCLLGKPVECIRSDELIPLLKETGNYPMHRYILSTDITDEVASRYKFFLKHKVISLIWEQEKIFMKETFF